MKNNINAVFKIFITVSILTCLILNIILVIQVSRIKKDVYNMTWDISSIDSVVCNVDTNVSELKDDIDDIKNDIDNIKSDVDDIEYYLQ